jgi:DNA-binding MarR family transcriptional regulator
VRAAPSFQDSTMTGDRDELILDIKTTMDEVVWRSFSLGAQVLRQYDLSLMQALALGAVIRLGPGVDMTSLSNATMLSPSTMTSAVDRLVERGLLDRSAHARDRRKVIVEATAAGRALHREMEDQDEEYWRWIMRETSLGQLEVLRDTFRLLLRTIETMKPEDFQRGKPFPATEHDSPS